MLRAASLEDLFNVVMRVALRSEIDGIFKEGLIRFPILPILIAPLIPQEAPSVMAK